MTPLGDSEPHPSREGGFVGDPRAGRNHVHGTRDPLRPGECVVRHLLPSLAADYRVVSAARELLELDERRRLALVPLVVRAVERSRHQAILLAGDEEERRVRPLEVDLRSRREAAAGEAPRFRHDIEVVPGTLLGECLVVGERVLVVLEGHVVHGRAPAKGLSTGQVPLKNDHLSESTPGSATKSITTAAAARSRWTISCVSNPPNECPMMIGFAPRARMLWTW